MKILSKILFILGCLVCPLVLAVDLDHNDQELDEDAKREAVDVSKDIKIKDIVEASSDYSYSSMNKPNPFVPPLVSSLVATEEIAIVSILQKYKLMDLRVVGLWRLDNGKSRALVMTPKNEGVIVTVGDSLGRRGGKVVKVESDKIIVREFSLASDGTRQFEDFKLWLGDVPVEEEKSILMRSQKVGLPNWFGYGSKNYFNDENFEEKRKTLLDNNAKNRAEEKNTVPIEAEASPALTPDPSSPASESIPESEGETKQ